VACGLKDGPFPGVTYPFRELGSFLFPRPACRGSLRIRSVLRISFIFDPWFPPYRLTPGPSPCDCFFFLPQSIPRGFFSPPRLALKLTSFLAIGLDLTLVGGAPLSFPFPRRGTSSCRPFRCLVYDSPTLAGYVNLGTSLILFSSPPPRFSPMPPVNRNAYPFRSSYTLRFSDKARGRSSFLFPLTSSCSY